MVDLEGRTEQCIDDIARRIVFDLDQVLCSWRETKPVLLDIKEKQHFLQLFCNDFGESHSTVGSSVVPKNSPKSTAGATKNEGIGKD